MPMLPLMMLLLLLLLLVKLNSRRPSTDKRWIAASSTAGCEPREAKTKLKGTKKKKKRPLSLTNSSFFLSFSPMSGANFDGPTLRRLLLLLSLSLSL